MLDRAVDILIVEDDWRDAELMVRALKKKNLANALRVVGDGAEALTVLFAESPDGTPRANPKVILLDLKLPKVSGLEVLQRIKSDHRTRYIPVVVVTSSREDPDIHAAYALGASSYVVKPVGFDDFVTAMGDLGLYWLLVNEPPR